MPSDVDPQILWETTKCAIRGFCISSLLLSPSEKSHQFTQLENKIQSLQNLQKHILLSTGYTAVLFKEEYDLLHTQRRNLFYIGLAKILFESEET